MLACKTIYVHFYQLFSVIIWPLLPFNLLIRLFYIYFLCLFQDSVDVGETSSSSSKNTNNVVDSPCFKISGRRPIKNIPFNIKRIKPNIPSEQPKCAAETVQNGHSDDAKKQMAVANTNDVFVFGSNKNTNNGFSFSVGNIFRGIGSSVKNIFSFKK